MTTLEGITLFKKLKKIPTYVSMLQIKLPGWWIFGEKLTPRDCSLICDVDTKKGISQPFFYRVGLKVGTMLPLLCLDISWGTLLKIESASKAALLLIFMKYFFLPIGKKDFISLDLPNLSLLKSLGIMNLKIYNSI